MFGWLRPRGIDALPSTFVDALRERVGEDGLAALRTLGREHGLFRHRFFQQPRKSYDDTDTQLRQFAAALAGVAGRLGEPPLGEPAIRLYRLALTLDPDLTEAHQGLAVHASLQGRTSDAATHARAALRALRGARPSPTDDDLPSRVVLARVLAEAHLEDRLGKEALARARELAAGHELHGRAAELYATAILAIADSEAPEAYTAYRRLFADHLVDAAHALAGPPRPAETSRRTR